MLLLIVAACGLQADPVRRLDEPEIAEVFQVLLAQRRAEYFSDGCGTRGPWSPSTEYLFTRAYPEKAEQFALELLEDPESCVSDLHFALNFLPRLSSKTSAKLETVLVRLVWHQDDYLSCRALESLSSLHGLGRYRGFFREHSLRGCSHAFEALACEVNPETIRFLEVLEIREKGQDPRFDSKRLSIQAHEALERIKILDGPNWKKQIESLLQQERTSERAFWAEEVAVRKAPELLRAYYQRLVDADRTRLLPLLWRPGGESFARRFLDSWEIKEASFEFDWNLSCLADLGGDLAPLEQRRLARFGLFGDAEPRLIEIMKALMPSLKSR